MNKINLDEILKGKHPKDINELNQILQVEMERLNNSTHPEFCGLSPIQMQFLLYNPFAPDSPFGFQNFAPAVLDDCPFFRLAEDMLRHTVGTKNPFPLTTTTASLPVKTVKLLYSLGHIRQEYIEAGLAKANKELDVESLHACKVVLEVTGLVRKQHGKWHLTKKGEKLTQPLHRADLFREIFQAFTLKFNWAYLDGADHPSAGQMVFPFSLSLLNHYGDQDREISFYSDKYLTAFPMLLEDVPLRPWTTPIKELTYCFGMRFFFHFAFWFGFAELVKKGDLMHREQTVVRKGKLMEQVLRLAPLKG
jgi:hypothetical protein